MKYYDIHVEIPKQGYSVGLKSEVELTDDEIIKKLVETNGKNKSGCATLLRRNNFKLK